MSRPIKIALGAAVSIVGFALVSAASFFVLVQTDWFKDKVRKRIVSVAEEATGGRVEIGRFNYNWHALTVEVTPFVLHGSEPSSGQPFFQAAQIQIGLKIISAFKKQVDIASLKVEKPQVYVTVAPDGSTNIPALRTWRTRKKLAQELINLKVQHFELRDGFVEYNSQRFPLDVQGEHLQAFFVYDASGPRYVGDISSRQLRVSSKQLKEPLIFDLASKIALEQDAVQVLETTLSNAGWKVSLKGCISDLASPSATFDVNASLAVDALKKAVAIPLEPRGNVAFQGQATIQSSPFQYKLEGKLSSHELGLSYDGVAVRNVGAVSHVELTPAKLSLPDVELSALDGHFRGSAELLDFKRLVLNGAVQGFSLRELAGVKGSQTGELNGLLSGPVHLNGVLVRGGLTDVTAEAKLDIVPLAGGVPVEGAIAVAYDQRLGQVRLGNSEFSLGSTHAAFSGVLGQHLIVDVDSKNLNDALPLFSLWSEPPPEKFRPTLVGSAARFDGTVEGPLTNLRISGRADVGPFILDQRKFDHVTTTFDLERSSVNFRTLTVAQKKMRLEGQGSVSLRDWKPEDGSSISALLSVSGADIQTLATENKIDLPLTGNLSGTIHVSGSIESPLASGTVEVANINAFDEHFDTLRGDVTYSATGIEVSSGELRSGTARIRGDMAYNHPANDWKDGSLRFDITTAQLSLDQIKHVQDFRPGLGGQLEMKAAGAAKVVSGVFDLTSLNGQMSLRNATVDGHPYGNLELTASTRLPILALSATVSLGGIEIQGNGEWRMEGDYPGQARVQIPRVPFDTLHDLTPGRHLRQALPFEGFLTGEATVSGPLNHPAAMKADITLSAVQLNARPNATPTPGAQLQDLVLRNAEPVRLEATSQGIDIRSASFTAKETSLNASGRLTFDSGSPWDLNVQGRINLSILQIFNPNLLASGASVVNLAVRGPLMEPQVDGRLELQNASLFLRDFPNGVDQANGLIVFDRNRATVQTLTAVTGGGNVTFDSGSFVGFRGPVLLYRLQASARNVRYRTPDGISTTVNSTLALVGTSENSVLSGTVTVIRAAFNPRTDVGALLAATEQPVSASSEQNEYLRGIQFDVRIESARSLEVETSLMRNIQADTSLRLRGTPERPVILGAININAGQIEFFGNKYTINRGTINFYNPARIEPVIDMDLETKVRGITVDISFAGSLSKLNFSYRSDPPLQANDIIALLAVGRTPSTTGSLAPSQTATDTSTLAMGSNALLGQAIAPDSGRLQKFFGVSHIKIDPQLTDVTSIPQARASFEQQVSSDITLTYIQNLAVTNQQIVRIEWDLNKRWAVVALRDENGAFGIDFVYKKRFK
jgi:translocation and assembly module TamB